MKEIGHLIRNKRKDLGLTQRQVAEKTGCTYATISSLEQGRHVSTFYLMTVLEILGLEIVVKDKESN